MKEYWKSLEDLKKPQESSTDKKEKMNLSSDLSHVYETSNSNRREFLKLFSFGIGTASLLSSCEQPIRKAIPYLIKPEEITPGKSSYYASSFYNGHDYCSIIVKTRDGRPIKIEGNSLSSITKGGTSARVQASILGLYDIQRNQNPQYKGKNVGWEELDNRVIHELNEVNKGNKKIVLLTSSIISPSTKSIINEFKNKYSETVLVQYDAISYSAIKEANKRCFNKDIIPTYRFDKAGLIISFGADFLGTWLSPVEFSKQYAVKRKISKEHPEMSRHIQFESGMSLTGSNADDRYPIKPSEEFLILGNIYNELAKRINADTIPFPESAFNVSSIVDELMQYKQRSIVLSGSNDIYVQTIVNGINHLLGNYEHTININRPCHLKQGNDKNLKDLIADLNNGKVGAMIMLRVNPVYDLSFSDDFVKGIKKTNLSVILNPVINETTEHATAVCPDHHYLESWTDAEPYDNVYSIGQPVIKPLFNTRQAETSLLKWTESDYDLLSYIKNYWKKNIFSKQDLDSDFQSFWNKNLQKGTFELPGNIEPSLPFINITMVKEALKSYNPDSKPDIELCIYEKVGIGHGEFANNPWIQELPDPITKICWDNYASVSPKFANEYNLKTGDIVMINDKIRIPVFVQPGQAYNTISVALGYGREKAGKIGNGVGTNGYKLIKWDVEDRKYWSNNISIKKTGIEYTLATTQTHHNMEGRALIRESTVDKYRNDPSSGNEMHEEIKKHHTSLYKDHDYPGHHWGMAIDLNLCTGCSACVIACQAENNIPVVGKEEVKRAHEMHWMRIDRYYSNDPENPDVYRQPVMCQHCDNAPCENVCPVAATNHSSEGINQMAYNRCIGTRYCNNNCPYKVRRFNWYDYTKADAIPENTIDPAGNTTELRRMVLNPDVTVRAKGVIEKCSFCVQRIQEKKLNAKMENRTLQDGEIVPACAQACPTNAIIFGDLNDEESKISKYYKNERNYHLLEEIHTLPSVGYLTRIRNKKS